MGPEGGFRGGTVVAEGIPEEVAKVKASYTGQFLAEVLSHKTPTQTSAKKTAAVKKK
jgi:excinuclease ABC subunit A